MRTITIDNYKIKLYDIPNFSRYGLTKTGDLYDFKVMRFKHWYKSKPPKNNVKNIQHGYYCMGMFRDDGDYKRQCRHRLLMTIFKNVDNSDTLYVNHINGIPGDDWLDNLEWTTPRDNLIHAIKNGLMPNSVISVDIKYLNSNKVRRFNSIQDAADHLGWSHSKLTHRLNENFGKLYPDKIIVKKANDKWPVISKVITRMGVRRKIKVIDPLGKETIYPTIMDASKDTGINTTSISMVARANSGKTVKKYKFYFEH